VRVQIVGRVANRVEGAAFTMHNHTYQLTANNGPNTLHGGVDGYHTRVWKAQAVKRGVKLELTSPDGDQGFPGTLQVRTPRSQQLARASRVLCVPFCLS